MEVWEVVAREEIRDLVTRYNSNSDTGRFAQLLELFDEDSVMNLHGTEIYNGPSEIINIFQSAKGRLTVGAVPEYIRHYTATHQIDIESETQARGRLYFAVITQVGLDHWGRYIDTYKKVDGRWKFNTRTVYTDGRNPQSTFAAKTSKEEQAEIGK